MKKARGLSLLSGGLDSQLAVRVLQEAGAHVEGVTFVTPFFAAEEAYKAAETLGIKMHVIDFTDDEVALIKNPPHGFGGAMNPCIDCHATMIKRAGELMEQLGYDFVATGEVMNQRPMSQNKQALGVVEKTSGLKGRLIRPLSAQLLEPTIPEEEGIIDRSKLCAISGRCRDEQIALAQKFNLKDYPSPAGGCKLTEKGFANRLRDLMENEGLDERRLIDLLNHARRFRLPGGTSVILGRDAAENKLIASVRSPSDVFMAPVSVPGPSAILPIVKSNDDLAIAAQIVCAWSRYDKFEGEAIIVKVTEGNNTSELNVPRPFNRETFLPYQIR